MNKEIANLFTKFYEIFLKIGHVIGRISGKYYFEDYLRVYPDDVTYYPFGIKRQASLSMINNFLNHRKFYIFASQFVKGKVVADVGCGSGYGVEVLKKAGAKKIYGSDISKHSIKFAKKRFGHLAEFSVQSIINLSQYPDNFFDATICVEVLEHIAEYEMEHKALQELKRITKKGGLIVVSTPNNEIMEDHGFSFRTINKLFNKEFKKYHIFENALIPFGERKKLWIKRQKKHHTGIIVSELIKESEVSLMDGEKPEFKVGRKAGTYRFGGITVDTKLLHNTHSWVIIATKD